MPVNRDARSSLRLASAALLSISVLASVASAQETCARQWCSGATTAINGAVTALTVWDPDGPGPEESLLIAGGIFASAGGVSASNIAAWDGEHWYPLGSGVSGQVNGNYAPAVYVLGEFDGQLVAAGTFGMAGEAPVNAIAVWNGHAWSPLGTGVDGLVTTLAEFNGSLFAGGQFSAAGGQPCANLARWDGSVWHPVAASMWGVNNQTVVNAITKYNGSLVVGGYFTAIDGTPLNNIAALTDNVWQPLGSGVGTTGEVVSALASHAGMLGFGGYFSVAGGVPCGSAASWDGSAWQPIGTGVGARTNIGGTLFPGAIQTLMFVGDDLYAGANFTHMDGVLCNSIARWDGATWTALGSGFPAVPQVGVSGGVAALAAFHDQIVAGGSLTSAAGRDSIGLARWGTCTNCCDGIDFNRDGLYPDTADIDDLLSVFSGGPCSNDPFCNDIDFNNDGLFPDTADIDSLLSVFSGGACL